MKQYIAQNGGGGGLRHSDWFKLNMIKAFSIYKLFPLLKSRIISRILNLLLFVISTKKPIRNIIFNYNQVASDPDVLSSIQSSWSCTDSPLLYPPTDHVVKGDLTCIHDKGLRPRFKKGHKYRVPSRIDFTKCRCYIADIPPRKICNGAEKPLQTFPHCRAPPYHFDRYRFYLYIFILLAVILWKYWIHNWI